MNLKYLWSLLAAMWLIGIAPAADLIQKGKTISVTATGVPDAERNVVNGVYPISDDGLLNMPHVGKVQAAGLSCEELEAALKTVFAEKEIYRNAEFQVLSGCILIGDSVNNVTVGGYVKKPGPVLFSKGMTIWQAIQVAGGKVDLADLKRVYLYRDGKRQHYNLEELKSREIELCKNDVIEVSFPFCEGSCDH